MSLIWSSVVVVVFKLKIKVRSGLVIREAAHDFGDNPYCAGATKCLGNVRDVGNV